MTRVLFDTNVVLDVLLDRKPHVEASAAAAAKARRIVSAILRVFGVASVNAVVIQEAPAIALYGL